MEYVLTAYLSSFVTLIVVGWWLRSMAQRYVCNRCRLPFTVPRGETVGVWGTGDALPVCDSCFAAVRAVA